MLIIVIISAGRLSGATYIRWGKTSCPGNGWTEVYSGYAGGSYFNHKGAAASMLCLPKDPIWKKYDDTVQEGGLIYGAEYDDRYKSNRESVLVGKHHYAQDVPCVVCHVQRGSSIMIPGRSVIQDGQWSSGATLWVAITVSALRRITTASMPIKKQSSAEGRMIMVICCTLLRVAVDHCLVHRM